MDNHENDYLKTSTVFFAGVAAGCMRTLLAGF